MASLGRSLIRLAEAALKTIAARPTRTSRREPAPGTVVPGNRRDKPQRNGGRAGAVPAGAGGYDPQPGDTADPGEVVWTWVPYEDDPGQGKDRPVLVIGRQGSALLALMLTSRDRNNAGSRHDGYVDIGSGAWDRQGRPSEVYLERLLSIDPQDVRRVGATLDRRLFERVMSRFEDSSSR